MKKKKSDSAEQTTAEKLAKAFDFPPLLLQDNARLEMMGNKEAIVEGVRGIILYDENIISLSVGKKEMKFCGQQLELRAFNTSSVIIAGEIFSVEFL